MALTLRSFGQSPGASSTSCVITKPSGLTVGDLMIAHVFFRNNNTTNAPNSGWTLIRQTSGTNRNASIWWKIADSSDTSATDFTFTFNGSAESNLGAISAFSAGYDTVIVASTSNGQVNASGTESCPGVTPQDAESLFMLFYSETDDDGGDVTTYAMTTSNPSWTEVYDLATNLGTDSGISCAYSSNRSATTATGTVSVSAPTNNTNILQVICIIPSGARVYPVVNDTVTLTENVSVSLFQQTLLVNVNDTVTLTESTSGINTTLGSISLSDTITLTESISTELNSFINVNDTVTITENLEFRLDNFIVIFDVITLTENITFSNPLNTSTFDSVTLTEDYLCSIQASSYNISVSDFIEIDDVLVGYPDTIYVQENISLELFEPNLFVNISDIISVSDVLPEQYEEEYIYLLESVNISLVSFINVSDAITLTENITLDVEINCSSAVDNVSIDESILTCSEFNIIVNDSIAVSESNTVSNLTLPINVLDSTSITENVFILRTSFINVSDSITITESLISENTQLGDVNVFDTVTVSEAITVGVTLFVNVSEQITVTENISVSNVLDSTSINDSITVTESVVILLTSFIIVNDTVTSTENVIVSNILDPVSASEDIIVTEFVNVTLETPVGSDLDVNVNELITLTESIIVSNLLLYLSVSEQVTVTENLIVSNILDYLSVLDNVLISESINLSLSDIVINVSEVINVIESTVLNLIYFISTFEGLSITENLNIVNTLSGIEVNDQINVTENSNTNLENFITINEIVIIDEYVIVSSQLGNINVYEIVSLSEYTEVEPEAVPLFLNVNDSITVSELASLLAFTPFEILVRLVSLINKDLSLKSKINKNQELKSTINSTIKIISKIPKNKVVFESNKFNKEVKLQSTIGEYHEL